MGSCKRFPRPVTKGGHDWCGEFAAVPMLNLPVVTMEEPKRKPGRPPKGE